MPRLSRNTGLLLLILAALPGTGRTEPATGFFRISGTLAEILGAEAAAGVAAVQPADAPVSWEVYVPEGYDPGTPAGLLVYISPTPSGELPSRWERVLAARNLIWIGANGSGNAVNVQQRALFALFAPTLIRRDYAVDPERIYLTGLSGGGKMASMVSTDHAHIFRGAIFNCGVEFWDRKPPRFEQIVANRYVFVTGEYDQALRPTKRTYNRYRKAGVANVRLMVIPGMGHQNPPPAELEEAIRFLDGAD